MSTLELEHLKHSSASGNNITLAADGSVTVDTTTLKVDATNNRVGVGTASPSDPLHVTASSGSRMARFEASQANSFIAFKDSNTNVMPTIGCTTDALELKTASSGDPVLGLKIDANGRATKPKQPAFLAIGNNGNYITTSPIPFPSVQYNIGGHYNNSNYTFTAPIDGRYFFHVHMGLVNGGSGDQIYPWFSVNGSQQQYTYCNFSTTWYSNAHLSCIFNLSANDTVKVTVSISGATYYNGGNETRFMGYLLG